ncbi:Phospholipid-transporting ATPase ID [Armadillidium vulgare]|nr:Phospholipid-transporting ATPase ID [Armadillidium vulgare]
MYYAPTKTHAKARTTTTLNEELGQIEYIFSDKTGTLTQNIMTFNKCSIAGRCYGDVLDPRTGEPIEITEDTKYVDLSKNPHYEPEFRFYDQTLVDTLSVGDPECVTFFKLLSLCHTVMPEIKKGKLEYQAQSPDEGALVSAARNFGFVFLSRTPNSITISVNGKEETHELLCILDFNNIRKRMSVILRKDGKIRLYCKGADSIIYERLKKDQNALKHHTQEHLNKFAADGLRTLVLAVKDLDERYFQDWKNRHHTAATSLENREDQLHEIYEEIEKDLILLGSTAIEDKLQDGVPQTIANLAVAGIKIWVLTGDKQETAINIGYSCQLLTDDFADIFIVDGETMQEVVLQLRDYRDQLNKTSTNPTTQTNGNISMVTFSEDTMGGADNMSTDGVTGSDYAIVINGHSLVWALNPSYEDLFLQVATQCKSVICCRVTPLQKALVVDLVKRYKKAVTLSIGDGANDVSMIKIIEYKVVSSFTAAHIGVGISGQEGMQAVLAADYSIAQFRFLERLLLVHGRWSYYRMCKFLRYFFYKNFSFTLCHFWFAFFVGFSAQTVYDPFFISTYNLCYTSMPVMGVGVTDQDVDDFNCVRYPKFVSFLAQTLYDPMFIAVYNLFYTSLPVLALGIFEQDVNAENGIKYPKLYTPGIQNALFNKMAFLRSSLHGFLTAFVLFFLPFGAYYNGMDQEGRSMSDHQLFGSVVATILVIVVTMQISLDTSYWTFFNHITIWGSLVFYFLLQYFYNYVIGGPYVGSLAKAMSEPLFYVTSLLTIVVLMLPVMAWRFYWVDIHPTLSDKVRYKQRIELKLASRRADRRILRTPSARRSRRSLRSGYAFAHQEGFGRLITSGKIMQPRNVKSNFFPTQRFTNGGKGEDSRAGLSGQHPLAPAAVEV